MTEYCFSDPIMYSGPVGVDTELDGWLVFLAPKQNSYPKALKDYECSEVDYGALLETGIYGPKTGNEGFALDIRDHVFWVIDSELGKEDITLKLRSLRFSHNKSLNQLLGDWVAEMGGKVLEGSETPAKMPARIPAEGRRPKASQQIYFGKTGS